MKAERESLVKRLADHKADPSLATRITTLKTELAKLQAQASGADLKAQIAAVDKAIAAIENPGKVTKPMSEAGKAAIKEGLARYHENRKVGAQANGPLAKAPAAPPAMPVAGKQKAEWPSPIPSHRRWD
jgi:hypothetical protein